MSSDEYKKGDLETAFCDFVTDCKIIANSVNKKTGPILSDELKKMDLLSRLLHECGMDEPKWCRHFKDNILVDKKLLTERNSSFFDLNFCPVATPEQYANLFSNFWSKLCDATKKSQSPTLVKEYEKHKSVVWDHMDYISEIVENIRF